MEVHFPVFPGNIQDFPGFPTILGNMIISGCFCQPCNIHCGNVYWSFFCEVWESLLITPRTSCRNAILRTNVTFFTFVNSPLLLLLPSITPCKVQDKHMTAFTAPSSDNHLKLAGSLRVTLHISLSDSIRSCSARSSLYRRAEYL